MWDGSIRIGVAFLLFPEIFEEANFVLDDFDVFVVLFFMFLEVCSCYGVCCLQAHKKLETTDLYTQLINYESDEWNVAHARNLEEESKLIEAGFEYVRYSDKDQVAIYRKRK